jgi:4-nitrophenyl phosphatase
MCYNKAGKKMIQSIYLIQMESLISGGKACDGASAFLKKLEEEGMLYLILCEQCGRSRDHLADYFQERGFRYVRPEYFYTSSMAAVDYASLKWPDKKRCGMIGGEGLKTALEIGGFHTAPDQQDFLFVGMDRNLSCEDYSRYLQKLKQNGIIVSVDNRRMMENDGEQMIGCGAVVRMLEYASGKQSISFGRGSHGLLVQALRYLHKDPNNVTYVGSSFKDDISTAIEMNMQTVLVTGGTSLSELGVTGEYHPDYIVENLIGLTK